MSQHGYESHVCHLPVVLHQRAASLCRRSHAVAAKKAEQRNAGGILILNPGAVTDGKYAVLNITPLGAVDPELCHL